MTQVGAMVRYDPTADAFRGGAESHFGRARAVGQNAERTEEGN
jgi:hypothetical protein